METSLRTSTRPPWIGSEKIGDRGCGGGEKEGETVGRKLLGGKYTAALLESWDYRKSGFRNASYADLLAGNSVAKLVEGAGLGWP